MRRPSLLFVFSDQMRGMDIGCAGNPDVRTPAMDRLAGEGVRLTNAIATSPVCGPNRAILLTGTYPTTNRVVGNDLPLPTGIPGLGTLLKAAGCRTGYVGKWHLDGVPRSKWTPPGPRRHGFDDFWAAYNCTHAYFAPKYYRDGPDVIEAPGRYEPEVQTDLALEFLDRQTPGGDPFCLVVSWGPPHDPYDQVPDGYRALYDPQALTLRANVVPETDNPLAARWECRRTTADYYAAITALDDQLARLLHGLDARGLADDTLVVFTSDHGDMLWSHGWMKKQSPYEESIQVPFLGRWPGHVPAGATSDVLLGTVDILPTLLGMMGLPRPAGVEGRDLSAHLSGHGGDAPGSVLIGNYVVSDEAARQNMPAWRGVRTARHTYVETPGRVPWLLFDNPADPFQQDNLIESAAHRAVRGELRDLLTGWLARTNDPFLPGLELIERLGLAEPWRERQLSLHGPAPK
jgi:arylsulfatase A-like enzyme